MCYGRTSVPLVCGRPEFPGAEVEGGEHLTDMEELRERVYLRAQGQKDPLVEYKNEGYALFIVLLDAIKQQVTAHLLSMAAGLQASINKVKNATVS